MTPPKSVVVDSVPDFAGWRTLAGRNRTDRNPLRAVRGSSIPSPRIETDSPLTSAAPMISSIASMARATFVDSTEVCKATLRRNCSRFIGTPLGAGRCEPRSTLVPAHHSPLPASTSRALSQLLKERYRNCKSRRSSTSFCPVARAVSASRLSARGMPGHISPIARSNCPS